MKAIVPILVCVLLGCRSIDTQSPSITITIRKAPDRPAECPLVSVSITQTLRDSPVTAIQTKAVPVDLLRGADTAVMPGSSVTRAGDGRKENTPEPAEPVENDIEIPDSVIRMINR